VYGSVGWKAAGDPHDHVERIGNDRLVDVDELHRLAVRDDPGCLHGASSTAGPRIRKSLANLHYSASRQ